MSSGVRRVCSECGRDKTRWHYWGKNRNGGSGSWQWYDDFNGGWLCYRCYMRLRDQGRIKKLRHQREKEAKERENQQLKLSEFFF